MAKTYRLTDAEGVALGAFDEVESAHLWGHRFAESRATTPPVELHDLHSSAVRRISSEDCDVCTAGIPAASPAGGPEQAPGPGRG